LITGSELPAVPPGKPGRRAEYINEDARRLASDLASVEKHLDRLVEAGLITETGERELRARLGQIANRLNRARKRRSGR
jgi:hypothetical protein